jgi:hypothetical protein
MALDQRIKDALDEARMVVLVVHVLLGFQFSLRRTRNRNDDGMEVACEYQHRG